MGKYVMVILWVCYGYPMVLTRKRIENGSKTDRKRIENGSKTDREKPNPDNVLRTATGSPLEQSSSPVKGREKE